MIITETVQSIKLKVGKKRVPVKVWREGKRICFKFNWSPEPWFDDLKDEIKFMQGYVWHGRVKDDRRTIWSVLDSARNQFSLAYLAGENPYAIYDAPLIDLDVLPRTCYRCRGKGCDRCQQGKVYPFHHQIEAIRFFLTRRRCILAAEPGLGKSLAAIYTMEYAKEFHGIEDWIWVAPRSALAAVQLECEHWRSGIKPEFDTYEGMKKKLNRTPQGIILDEAQRIREMTTQRSQAIREVREGMWEAYKDDCFILEMTGTPAPKEPTNWWNLAETACPGFFRESDPRKFKARLAIIKPMDAIQGGTYPKLLGWRDREDRCEECGQLQDHPDHHLFHEFIPCKNEVANLYKRMKGLTLVQLKSTCLDLPEKQYRVIHCPPSQETLNALEILKARSTRAITFLTLSRELSSGFIYQEELAGVRPCTLCLGSGKVDARIAPTMRPGVCSVCDAPLTNDYVCDDCGFPVPMVDKDTPPEYNEDSGETACPFCSGTGVIDRYVRTTAEVDCPKDQALRDLLDEYRDVGRFIVFASFRGSLDRCERIIREEKWDVIRVDGDGWRSSLGHMKDYDYLKVFQGGVYPKVVYLAHPASGGTGATLTASPAALFFDNGFEGEHRLQSIDRGHRPGMDLNRGFTIIDLIHLPTDSYVLQNLEKKVKLQSLTMGQVADGLLLQNQG